jgi:Uncharacterized protein conserved in bacteria (DUF2169)
MCVPMGRVVVVQAEGPVIDANRGADALKAQRSLRMGVATMLRHEQGLPRTSVLVKLTLTGVGDRGEPLDVLRPALKQRLPEIDRPSRLGATAPPGLLDYASDFAPKKTGIDIHLVGHAHAASPVSTIEGRFGIGPIFLPFKVNAPVAARQLPLAAPYLSMLTTEVGGRFAPAGDPSRFELSGQYPDAFDYVRFQNAPPGLVVPFAAIAPDAQIVLDRFSRHGGDREMSLPNLLPVITADVAGESDVVVPIELDTIWIDVDVEEVVLVWRGDVPETGSDSDIDRLVVSLENLRAPRDAATRLSDTQRGQVHFAMREEDAQSGTPPPEDHPRLESARYGTWGAVAPEPRIPLDQYANLSAELAEFPADREAILRRNDLNEDLWLVEERAWLERFASEALEAPPLLSIAYGELFQRAQEALAKPEEAQWTIADYATLHVKMERSGDLMEVLGEVPMTLPQWMRLERRCLARAESDPAAQAELERATQFAEENIPDPFAEDPADEAP